MRARTDAATSQTAAQANKTRTGTRHDASISAGATGGIAVAAGETEGDDDGIALTEKKRTWDYSYMLGFSAALGGAAVAFRSHAP